MRTSVHEANAVSAPLPWRERVQSVPLLPGPGEQWLERLPHVLDALEDLQPGAVSISVAGLQDAIAVNGLQKLLGPGLVTREKGQLRPTAEAQRWRATEDPGGLIGLLHRHVRLIGELLDLLTQGPLSHEELRNQANSRYSMGWTTLDQVRRRTTWLRDAGMIELYGGQVHLTAQGQALLTSLMLGAPDPLPSEEAVQVASPSPVISKLLTALEVTGHQSRALGKTLYLPSPEDITGVEIIFNQVSAATPVAPETALDELLQQQGKLAESSVKQARGTLKALGLIELTGPARWSASEGARAWLESDDPVDLIAVIHANLWYFGEILRELSVGPLSAVELTKRSGTFDRPALSTPAVRSRLALLRQCGAVEKLSHQTYQLTPLGRGLLTIIPLAERAKPAQPPTPSDDKLLPPGEAEGLAAELRAASRDSRNPSRMEYAVRDALRYLDLDVEHLAGPGKTDLIATLSRPANPTSIAVEAKTTAEGLIPDSQISFEGLREHRSKCGAPTTVLVGAAFHTRVHSAAAKDGHVAILHSDTLAEVVLMHAKNPFSPNELYTLFDSVITAEQRESTMRETYSQRSQRMSILHAIITQLDLEIHDDDPMYPGGWLGVNDLRRDLRKLGASVDIISRALDLLSAPFIDAVEKDKDRFRLTVPPTVAAGRLRALAQACSESAARGVDRPTPGDL